VTKVRHLFSDIRHRGDSGSYSHLARFLAAWRRNSNSPLGNAGEPPSLDEEAHAPPAMRTLGPMTGRRISPLTTGGRAQIEWRGQGGLAIR
jgi:hypothetical protein